jgi:hypothetical protein
MTRWFTVVVVFAANLAAWNSILAAFQQPAADNQPRQKITRVKRPNFSERDWDGIYFRNLFEQGLVGPRPAVNSVIGSVPSEAAGAAENSHDADPNEGQFRWNQYITAEVLENEIKALHQQLQQGITTPSRYATEYAETRQRFAMLSLLFAIVSQYEGQVRWQKYGALAQASFAHAAATARVGTIQSYQTAKSRREELGELIRGGTLEGSESDVSDFSWPEVIDRVPIMIRLSSAIDETLKTGGASETVFSENLERMSHEANLVSALSQVLIQHDMPDADDQDYSKHALTMNQAAQELIEACKSKQFDPASTAINRIQQSCNNCHEAWR